MGQGHPGQSPSHGPCLRNGEISPNEANDGLYQLPGQKFETRQFTERTQRWVMPIVGQSSPAETFHETNPPVICSGLADEGDRFAAGGFLAWSLESIESVRRLSFALETNKLG